MILTVTINPLLERVYTFQKVELDSDNRNGSLKIKAGGKGINVSRQLNCLGVPNLAFTFLGGLNGKLLREALDKEKLSFTSVRTSSDNREASIIINSSVPDVNTFFAEDPVITSSEAEEFKIKLEKMIRNCEIVIFSGSSPSGPAESIIPFGIETANKLDKISICDTYGKYLSECIDISPTIIHNTISEIESSLNLQLDNEKDKTDLLNLLYSKGIKQVYLTNGPADTYASNFDYHYKVVNPSIKEVYPAGSGDSFVAGVAFGWYNDLTFEETLATASALGTVNACKLETSSVKFEEITEIKSQVKIFPVGKKMKLIDVTPR